MATETGFSNSAPQAKYYAAADQDKVIPGQYIVVFKEQKTRSLAERSQYVASRAAEFAVDFNASILHQYDAAIPGLALKMDSAELGRLLAHPDVEYVEEDTLSELFAVQNNPTWGLDRIDERTLPLDNLYDSDLTGAGVNAYIIDTGIDLDHPNFTGRVRLGTDVIGDGRNGNDCNGHGTHVAGTVGSETWGVAKDSTLWAVRVFGCGNTTSTSNILNGMNWVISNAQLPAVANMSLGGGASTTQDNLVQSMVNAGIVTVVAAGNDNSNACNFSPARATNAITVASSTSSDSRSSFSNWGSCVDIFGPGSSITSTWLNGGSNTISGTSMASPHVAGVAALALQNRPSASVGSITNELINNATTNAISGPNGSPNRLLYMAYLNGGTPPPPPPPPPGNCSFEDDFTTSTGWVIDGASTCSTGTYIRGNPTLVTNGGITTQPSGDAGGDGFAAFTASNSSAGVDDVDGGVCIARSPAVSVSTASTLSIDWFHGQRDSGDDPSGDFFRLEYSLNGGSSFNSLVNLGDSARNASWTTSTASIPAGSNVVIRVSTSDGSSAGDLIEGGVDSVSICSQ
ncbi:MAG: hypothetical protein Tsb002_22330 [Wenzhouxiangellaceae bacterium]